MPVPSSSGASKSNLACSGSPAQAKQDQNARFAAVEDITDHLSSVIRELDPAEDETSAVAVRVKTRILNFGFLAKAEPEAAEEDEEIESAAVEKPPIGWIAVIDGPGRGNCFPVVDNVSQIGRGDGHAIQLAFGDDYISRQNHASIVYRSKRREFELHFDGKANPVQLNDQKILGVELLRSGDRIQLGVSTLRFLAFCDAHFAWEMPET